MDGSLKQKIWHVKVLQGSISYRFDQSTPSSGGTARWMIWITHLEILASDSAEDSVHRLWKQFLFRFQVPNVLGRIREASTTISILSILFADRANSELEATFYDARQFAIVNNYMADVTTLQLYFFMSCFLYQRITTRTGFL